MTVILVRSCVVAVKARKNLARRSPLPGDHRAERRRDGVDAETDLLWADGRPISDEIVDEAKRWPADLIVMATHGRGGIG